MESNRTIERAKLERPVNIRALRQEASCVRVISIDTTSEGVGFMSMVPLKVGTAVVIDNPDLSANVLLLCNVIHCTLIPGGKYHIGAMIEQSSKGNLTTTQIPSEWWKRN